MPTERKPMAGDLMPAWLVTSYDDVRAALAEPNLSNSLDHLNADLAAAGTWVLGERTMGLDRNLLRSDPPAHTRLRRLASRALTPAGPNCRSASPRPRHVGVPHCLRHRGTPTCGRQAS